MASAARLLSHVVVLLLLLLCSPMATALLPANYMSANFDPELASDISRVAFGLLAARRGDQRPTLDDLVGLLLDLDNEETDIFYYAEIWCRAGDRLCFSAHGTSCGVMIRD
ncbi:hypothetical protein AXF42_Ash021330 [Apostasia shenzhenica]|uniref:Uncharacterized protein n=1 Tax=Apostasia shenzhenica TaxID=1088818 RepID=A0A2I0B1L7_9ASPA|nr:hypothetical protein AXF42_Ash021330 [Apostasia shenzhenica]